MWWNEEMIIAERALCAVLLGLAWTLQAELAWETGAYAPQSWTPLAGDNLLAGRQAALTGDYYAESGRCVNGASLLLLTDGAVPGTEIDWSQVVGLANGATLTWTFDEPMALEKIRISSRWADAGRDGISVTSVRLRYGTSSRWQNLNAPALSYATGGSSAAWEGTGASFATLANAATGFLAQNVTGLRIVFGTQDNNGAGYVEIEAAGTSMTPDPVVTATLLGAEATRASVGGVLELVGLNAASADVYLAFGPAAASLPAPVKVASNLVRGDLYRFVADNLQPGAVYAYSAFASNSLGKVSSVVEGRFTLPTEEPLAVRVNEVCAAADVDWFELYNPNALPVDLTDWLVSDDPAKKPEKWKRLPAGASVPAHGYLVVYADDVNAYTSGAVHIDVGFSSSGEAVAIARPDGTLVSSFAYPMQLDDISYGYVEVNGELALRYFRTPTPGAPNDTEGFEGPTAPIVFSEAHGYKTAPFALALSCPDDPAAEIRYTLDGKAPSSASARYTQPLAISSTTVVRAAAVNPAAIIQREGVASYIFLDQVLSQAPSTASPGGGFPASGAVNNQAMRYGMRTDLVSDPVARAKMLNGFTNSIVTISIAIDPANLFNASTGIYVNVSGRGLAWERQGMVEQIDPVNGTVNEFFAPMGLRIRGAASRQAGYPKHSLRLFFRSEYGMKRVEFPFFGDEGASSFRRMDLRCSQNYSWANNPTEAWGWMRDAFVTETFERDAQRDVGQPYTRSRYCNLFINGVYWGLYQTQERADDHFASTYLGGESEDYDAYNVNELNSGSDDARQALYNQMIAGFTSNAAYLRALGCNPDGTRNPDYPVYIDVTNLILRTQIGHYCADGDSPCSIWSRMPNNYFVLYNHTEASTGFKWFCHDGEHALGMGAQYASRNGLVADATCNPVAWGVFSGLNNFNSNWLNHELMKNAEYRIVWADLFHRHFFPGGVLSTTNNVLRFRSRMAEIDDAIVNEAARWGRNGQTYATWTNACEYIIADFIERRFPLLLANYRAEGWYPSIDAPTLELSRNGALASFVSSPGTTIYYTRDGSDPRLFGGATSASAETFTEAIAVDDNGFAVCARARSADGEWSALSEIDVPGYVPVALTATLDAGTLTVAYANLPHAARLLVAWDSSDLGEAPSNWSHTADLDEVAAGTGALRVGAPAGFDSSAEAVLRVFLVETIVSSGREKLAYVRGDGTQRVALDYTPTASTRCRVKFAMDMGAGGVFVGTDKGNDRDDWRFFSNKDKGDVTYLDFPSDRRISGAVIQDSTTIYDYEFGNFYLKDAATGEVLLSGDATAFPANYAPATYLFSLASAGSHSYGTVYSLKFYEGETLARDYEPARDENGVVCLYESMNGRFYYPSGGALAGGPVVGVTGGSPSLEVLAASAPVVCGPGEWPAGGLEPVSSDLASSLRVAEVMSVPVLGGSDGEEYIVLTNLAQTAALHIGGVQVTCTKTGDAVAKCAFTLPLGLTLAPGASLCCTKADFWPDGKITDGNVDVRLFDAGGALVQHLYLSTKWTGNVFRMCDGKGGAFCATSFAAEVVSPEDWRPSIPDIDDRATRQAVADAILSLPALQAWLAGVSTAEEGAEAVAAFRGDAATLAACYLVASLPETEPEIELAFSAIAFDAAGKIEFGVELRQHGALIDRALNGILRLEHLTELSGESVDTVDLGSVVPVPLEKRTLSRPADGERHFFRLRISER